MTNDRVHRKFAWRILQVEKLLIDPSFIHKILLIHPFPLFLGNIWTYLNLLQGPRCTFHSNFIGLDWFNLNEMVPKPRVLYINFHGYMERLCEFFMHWMIFFAFSLTTPRLPTLEAQCPQFPGGGRGANVLEKNIRNVPWLEWCT